MNAWELIFQLAVHLSQREECAVSVHNKIPQHTLQGKFASEIIGGIPLRTASSSPWMVAVGERSVNGSVDWYCAGALIQSNKVLTAAHCVVRRKPDVVRVGELDFASEHEPSAPADLPVSFISVHPEYSPPVNYNDIAMLHLGRNASFSKYVRPVCLPSVLHSVNTGQSAMLTGWGHQFFGGDSTDILHEVSVTIMNSSKCSALYSRSAALRRSYPRGIIDSQLCAGDEQGGKDACQNKHDHLKMVISQEGMRTKPMRNNTT
ncbi:venom protease-like isoform X2 [Bacillus rossius redtenbacheri]|uniref:venom protease-like isoform X2 n=1 Tax=Bacillus rossius redtenbacheri TaxID=93214 RepID=UPI002FDE6CD6